MAARKLSRWHKASALVPMAVLVVAWGAALGNTGLATADDRLSADEIPDVPSSAFEQPASVQETPAGIDSKAGAEGAVKTLSTNGIPSVALSAYRRAEMLLSKADPDCKLPWNLVAAIGRVESDHGRTGSNALDTKGVARPGIYGIALDGSNGTARIMDTDNGALDNDSVYDRAVGPMQFIPGTWKSVGVDSDNDGRKNPQNINDAATAAGVYLCAGSGDLTKNDSVAAAVKRYNRSDSYVDLVMRISAAYADGDFSPAPNGTSSGAILTSRANDQTLTPAQRNQAAAAQRKAENASKNDGKGSKGNGSSGNGGSGGSTGGGTGGGGTGSVPTVPGTGGGGTGSGGGSGSGTVGGAVQNVVKDSPLAPVTKPITGLLSAVEANTRCTLEVVLIPSSTYRARFAACVTKYTT